MSPKLRLFTIAAVVAYALDMGTKYLVNDHLTYNDRLSVIEGFFYLTHVRNPGAAFGLFVDADPVLRRVSFIGISIVAIGVIFSFLRQLAPGDRLSALALGLILGGALGNLTDRILRDEVVDFLHFRLWGGFSWPDFNFADSFIVVGVAILIFELLATEGEDRASVESEEPRG
jgi:signal peptidase II